MATRGRRTTVGLSVLATVLGVASPPGWAADLISNGETQTSVIVSPDSLPETRDAGADVARILGQMAGKGPVAVVARAGDATTPTRIWLGDSPGARRVFDDVLGNQLRDDEIVVAVRDADVLIAGKDTRYGGTTLQAGTSMAAYTFLQRQLSVRWFWPGDLGEEVPTVANLTVTNRVERSRPKVQGRWLRFMSNRKLLPGPEGSPTQEGADAARRDALVDAWFRRQRGGGSFKMRAGHAFSNWYSRFGKTHPDFFAVQPDGTRRPYPNPEKVKLDVTNPAVAGQWLSDVEEAVRRTPYLTMFSGSENDGGYSGYCMSAECRAWDATNAPRVRLVWASGEQEYPALTDRYVKFWNRLAQLLRDRFPDRDYTIGVWAYGALRTPPVEGKPASKLVVGFVGNLAWDGDATRQSDRTLWKQWSQLVARMVWRPNLFHYRWGLPGSMATRLGEDFKFLADHNLVGIDVDTVYHDWATRGFDYYLLAQLAWDPEADVRAIRSDYCRRAFGPEAGPEIEKYLISLEESETQMINRIERRSRYEAIDVYIHHLGAERRASWRAMLMAARGKVAGATSPAARRYLTRIDFLTAGLDFTDAQVEVMRSLETVRTRRKPLAASLAEARTAIAKRDRVGEAAGQSMAIGWLQWSRQMKSTKMERYLIAPSQ